MKQISSIPGKMCFIGLKHIIVYCVIFMSTPFSILFVKTCYATEEKRYKSIESLIKSNVLACNIRGMGGYQDRCINMSITNLTNDSAYVIIEAGRILDSRAYSTQNIFVVKTEKLRMAAKEQKDIGITGYCCQRNNHAPSNTSTFYVGRMANDTMQKLAKYIEKEQFSNGAIQNAVWFFSNNQSLASITDNDISKQKKLKDSLSIWCGIPIPWYTVTYAQNNGMLFSNRPETIKGNLEYYIKKNADVTILVRDTKGKIIDILNKKAFTADMNADCEIELNVKKYPKGYYYIYVFNKKQVVQKKYFKV